MNPKINKLKAERAKNDGKIADLQTRNREIDADIIKLEMRTSWVLPARPA